MDLQQIMKLEADLIVKAPTKYVLKSGYEIMINTLTVKQVMLIHPYLTIITAEDLTEMQRMIEELDFANIPVIMSKYIEPISKIIEIAINEDITEKADFEEFFQIILIILSKLGNLYFRKSIILMQKMSLERPTEIIAARKFLTSLN